MRDGPRTALLGLLLVVALVALAALVAGLRAPLPGGAFGDPISTDGSGRGGGGGGGGGAEQPEPQRELCPPTTPTGRAASVAVAVPLVPSRRRGAWLGALGLVALAGCFGDPCAPARVDGGSGGEGPGDGRGTGTGSGQGSGSGSGGGGAPPGGSGTGAGPGTGAGTAPDPPKLPEGLVWILAIVAAVLGLLLLLAFVPRPRDKADADLIDPDASGPDESGGAAASARAALAAAPEGPARGVIAAYVRALTALERAGVRRQRWETAREVEGRAPAAARDALRPLTRLYESARHGGVAPDAEAARRAEALADAVERAVAAPKEASAPG